jgi:ribosome-associated protein
MAMNEYVQVEAKKIYDNASYEFPKNQALVAAWIAAHFKGEALKVFDMSKHGSICDCSVLVTALNPTQARSMADEIAANLKHLGAHVYSYEGYESADWILLDFGDTIVHIFQLAARNFHNEMRIYCFES